MISDIDIIAHRRGIIKVRVRIIKRNNKKGEAVIMGVKGDDVLLAGVNEGTESPNKVAKAAKRTFAAVPDLLSRKPQK